MPSNTYVVAKCPAAEHFRHFVHFRPYLTVGYSNVYPEFINRNLAKGFFGVTKACICCGAIYDLENLFIDQYTHF